MGQDARIRFALSRGHASAHLVDGARRFAEVLQTSLGQEVRLFVAADYQHLLAGILDGSVQLAWMPPLLQVQATGARLVAACERRGTTLFRSALFVRADSPHHTLRDLRAVHVAWTDRHSAAGYLFPRLHLQAAGVDLAALRESFLGSPAACISAVIDGKADLCACFVTDAAGDDTEVARQNVARIFPAAGWRLRALAVTDSIPPDGFTLSADVDAVLGAKITQALLTLSDQPGGKEAIHEFLNADRLVTAPPSVMRIIERLRQRVATLSL